MPVCALCHSTNYRFLLNKETRDYYRCSCGFIFSCPDSTGPMPASVGYDENYYAPWELSLGERSPWRIGKIATFDDWLDIISRFAANCGVLLDVGCATGCFLERAQLRGWSVAGVELSGFAASEAKKTFGDRVVEGTLDNAGFDSNRFEAVTAFDVIEHVADPVAFIKKIRTILKPAGLLVISTADTSSASCRIFGKQWPQFKSEHCSYFSKKVLRETADKCGFETMWCATARKQLTIGYIASYFRFYPSRLFGTVFRILGQMAPQSLQAVPFHIPTGELLTVLRRRE